MRRNALVKAWNNDLSNYSIGRYVTKLSDGNYEVLLEDGSHKTYLNIIDIPYGYLDSTEKLDGLGS